MQAWEGLAEVDLANVQRLLARPARSVEARSDFVREGDIVRHCYVVQDGWACQYKTLADGRRQILAFLLPGDLCDTQAFSPRELDYGIAAITKLSVIEVGCLDLAALQLKAPALGSAFRWCAISTSASQREWLLSLGQRSAYERLAHLMAETFMRLDAIGLVRNNSCPWPLTQADLAEASGLTTVHVNRTVQDMRRNKLIEISRRTLHVPDLDELLRAGLYRPADESWRRQRSEPGPDPFHSLT